MTTRILIVEDDPSIAQLISLNLSDLGYETVVARTGREGLDRAITEQFHLVVLDLMLPELSGNEVLKGIRQHNINIPILVVTLKSELVDKVVSLELGADDYLTKPFGIQELVARVKALLRRTQVQSSSAAEPVPADIVRGELRIDQYRRKVTVSGNEVELTPKQFDLLVYLASSPGRAYTRADLLNSVWGYEHSGYEHTIDSHVNRLRAQIEPNPAKPTYILTVWGVGYRFAEIKAKVPTEE